MEDFREPPPDPGGDGPSEDDHGSQSQASQESSQAPTGDSATGSAADFAQGTAGDPADDSSKSSAADFAADGTEGADDADDADDECAAGDGSDDDVEGAVADSLRQQLDGIVDDSRLIAAAEASRLRGIYDMLQDALEHPRVFVPCRPGTTRADLTAETAGWVRSALAQEIGAAMGITKGQASGLIDDAEQLCEALPATLDALESGQITSKHAATMMYQATGLDAESTAKYEAEALPRARTQSPTQFRKNALRVREEMFPETITERKTEAAKKRRVDCYGTYDGMGVLSITAPIEVVQSLSNAATQTARALKAAGDDRTQAQIETDALVDALMHGFTTSSDTTHKPGVGAKGTGSDRLGSIRPTVYVTVPVMTLLGHTEQPAHLDGHGPIDPDTARKLAAHAPSFTRLLTHPETGAVLSVGRNSYTVPADLRRAVELRDETCIGIGCNRPATTCDLDHGTEWQHGGETSLNNLTPKCESHHNLRHHTQWQVTSNENGDIDWISPLGKKYRVPRPTNVQFAAVDHDAGKPETLRKDLPNTPPF